MKDGIMKSQIYNLRFNEEKGFKTIAKELGISKNTVKKYVSQFEENISHWGVLSPKEYDNQITEMFKKGKIDTKTRKSRVLSESHKNFIKKCLAENEKKKSQNKRKQLMKVIDIYEELADNENYKGKYGAVLNYVNKISDKKKETFIKRVFEAGECVEFDWGNVELVINGKVKNYKLAVFTACHSNYRWAKLYEKENTEAFIDSHISFHKNTQGVFKRYVYDNMRVAVAKFVGKYEKTPTENLIKMSSFYNFDFMFCNAYSGNEKGNVERSVEFIRRKSYSFNNEFNSFEDAQAHLNLKVYKLNTRLDLDKIHSDYSNLKNFKYHYSYSEDVTVHVTKYSTICIENSHYSVPDKFTGKIITIKKSIDFIHIYENDKRIYSHNRNKSHPNWIIDIEHYKDTFLKKPGALKDSLALKQVDPKIKFLYENYYSGSPKDFIDLITIIKENDINSIIEIIEKLKKQNLGISSAEIGLALSVKTDTSDKTVADKNVTAAIHKNIEFLERIAQ